MAWTAPRTWTVGETVTAAMMNAHVRDNLLMLHDDPLEASATQKGIVTTGAQTFAGTKTGAFAGTFAGSALPSGIGGATYARATGNFTKNNNTAFSDVTDLAFAIAANEVLEFRFMLFTLGVTGAGLKFQLTGPASPTAVKIGLQPWNNAASAVYAFSTDLVKINWGGLDVVLEIIGLIRNGANAGTVQLRAAQNAATVGDSIIYADSYVVTRRLA